MKKKTAFWVGIVTLVGLYVFTALAIPESLPAVGPTIVLAIAFATVGYQSANVADNALKGKFYRSELAPKDPAGGEGGAP